MGASDWTAIVGVSGTLVAFSWGLWQFARSQQWKRAEFVAEQMKAFQENPKIKLALQMLDWEQRIHDLPIGEGGALVSTQIDDELLAQALLHHSERPEGFSPPETYIRDCFDEFLDGLERFEHYLETKLVKTGDLAPYLEYPLEILGSRQAGRKPAAFYTAVRSYLRGYGYTGVERLLRRFGFDISVSASGA